MLLLAYIAGDILVIVATTTIKTRRIDAMVHLLMLAAPTREPHH